MAFRHFVLLNAVMLGAQTLPPPVFPAGRFYAPYIMPRPTPELPPDYLSQISMVSGIRYFTLAFIVGYGGDRSGEGGGCLASWGSRTPLSQETALSPAIQNLRSEGGDVLISFGGEAGKELAIGCDNVAALQAQYQAVIDKYKLTVLDMDIEGNALKDSASVERRNAALAAIQAANPGIQVSYTLPVATDGLTQSGIALLTSAMSHGVKVAAVNLMTMDYGSAADPLAMGAHAITAVNGAVAQMLDNGIRARIGICPMIGSNDVKPEVFSLSDARLIADWAQANPIVMRMSMWSVSRDFACPEGSTRSGSSCSGVAQKQYEFSGILNTFH
jgi:Glycosyl hydrolases family 18